MKHGKVWGQTEKLFAQNNIEIHRIKIKAGGFCSQHSHAHKWNLFYVEKGTINIEVWKNNYNLRDVTELRAGQMTKVPPGERHRFRALEESIVYEIYWTEIEADDIFRENVGGCY